MPPMLSDDESDGSGPDVVPARKAKTPVKPTSDDEMEDVDATGAKGKHAAEEKDEDEDGDEDDEDGEGEYAVEKILQHATVKGKVLYQIKWMGYDAEEDLTWEPVDNLVGAKDLLATYHDSIGGTPQPTGRGSAKKSAKKGGSAKKRSAAESELDSPVPVTDAAPAKKRGRKSATNGTTSSSSWEPPVGSWESHLQHVAAILQDEGPAGNRGKEDATTLEGLLVWTDGKKTQHKMAVLRQKCPQKLLDYYEQHLVFGVK